MGDIIKIRGLTRHGKNRVREHGEMWEVTEWKSDLLPGQQSIRSIKTGEEALAAGKCSRNYITTVKIEWEE